MTQIVVGGRFRLVSIITHGYTDGYHRLYAVFRFQCPTVASTSRWTGDPEKETSKYQNVIHIRDLFFPGFREEDRPQYPRRFRCGDADSIC
ncbi:hypothetical protein [Halomicrobium urmianum]|uniref:hypothetical protein n=1 Tax=Halomicrobium urmianum TaxID=1586233 RepID=UPI001CD9BCC4|nr:hypothetical protein [Halomicrobium urmianum]